MADGRSRSRCSSACSIPSRRALANARPSLRAWRCSREMARYPYAVPPEARWAPCLPVGHQQAPSGNEGSHGRRLTRRQTTARRTSRPRATGGIQLRSSPSRENRRPSPFQVRHAPTWARRRWDQVPARTSGPASFRLNRNSRRPGVFRLPMFCVSCRGHGPATATLLPPRPAPAWTQITTAAPVTADRSSRQSKHQDLQPPYATASQRLILSINIVYRSM